MMLRAAPMAARPSSRSALVCRAAAEQRPVFRPHLAAAFAAASLLMSSSPVWAAPAAPALTYEQELQALIQKRTGSEFNPELKEIPNEQAIEAKLERELINEAVAAEEAEQQVSLTEAAVLDDGAIKRAALEEVSAVQAAASGVDSKANVSSAQLAAPASGGPTGQTAIIVAGGFATLAVAAVAMGGNSGGASSDSSSAATPAPAAPADAAAGAAPVSSDPTV